MVVEDSEAKSVQPSDPIGQRALSVFRGDAVLSPSASLAFIPLLAGAIIINFFEASKRAAIGTNRFLGRIARSEKPD